MYLLRWEPSDAEVLDGAAALAADVSQGTGPSSCSLPPLAAMLFGGRVAAAMWVVDHDDLDLEIATRPEFRDRGIERLLALTFIERRAQGRRAAVGARQPEVAALLSDLGFEQRVDDRWVLTSRSPAFFEQLRRERTRLEQTFRQDRGSWPSAQVTRSKRIARSEALGRVFHADVFDVGDEPALLVLIFGGSGVSKEEYTAREGSILNWLDRPLAELAAEGRSLRVVYVTAPFDLPLAHLTQDEDEAERWTRHVDEDLLALGSGLPVYLLGYSGGAALALCGAHLHCGCIGAGAIGGDGLQPDLDEGSNWRAPLRLQYGGRDRVYSANADAITDLVEAELAILLRRGDGGHSFKDYVTSGAIGGQLRHALRLAQQEG